MVDVATISGTLKLHDCAVFNRYTGEVQGWLDMNADGTATLKIGEKKWRRIALENARLLAFENWCDIV